MAEELQSLLEKINREGVEKAEAEAARITGEAEARAKRIVADAEAAAAKAKADAEAAAAAYEAGARERLAQAARDLVNETKAAIGRLLEKTLGENVEKALGDEATAVALAAQAMREVAGGAEISAPEKLAAALKAQLASRPETKVTIENAPRAGFTILTDGGRIENTFTPEAIAGELARRLRPDLAALLK